MVERYARRAEENGSRCGVCASAWRRFSSGASMTAAVLWIAVGIAACGGSTSAPTPTPSAVMGTAQLAIKVTLTGAVAETGELIQSVVGTTCETFAEGRSHTFLIPSGPANATLAGNPFHLTAPIAQYAGPGDYSLDTEGFGGNQFTTAVTVGPGERAGDLQDISPVRRSRDGQRRRVGFVHIPRLGAWDRWTWNRERKRDARVDVQVSAQLKLTPVGPLWGVRAVARRLIRSRALVAAVSAWSALGIAACGGSTTVPRATPSTATGIARLTINVTLTGLAAEAGGLIQSVPSMTYETFAQGHDHMLQITAGPSNATLAGNPFQLTAPIPIHRTGRPQSEYQLVEGELDVARVAIAHARERSGPEDLADHRGVLEQALAIRRERVQAGGNEGLH